MCRFPEPQLQAQAGRKLQLAGCAEAGPACGGCNPTARGPAGQLSGGACSKSQQFLKEFLLYLKTLPASEGLFFPVLPAGRDLNPSAVTAEPACWRHPPAESCSSSTQFCSRAMKLCLTAIAGSERSCCHPSDCSSTGVSQCSEQGEAEMF